MSRSGLTRRASAPLTVAARPGLGRGGSVTVLAAIAMTGIIGMAALTLDIGAAYTQRAQLQKVADSAAMAGAIAWVKSGSTPATKATIGAVVVANGWAATIIQQPTLFYVAASPRNAINAAIQVKLSASSAYLFAQAVTSAQTITTTATAIVELATTAQPACLLSLTTLMVNATVNVNGCAAAANSAATNAVTVNSGGSLSAASINTPGKVVNNGTITGTIKTGATAATNPYAGYAAAAGSGFVSCQNYSNQTTLSAGCWSNVNINSGVNVTLNPGTFFFTGINVNSGGSLKGTGGVTIVTQNNFSPNGPVTLTAPGTGSFAGMAIYATGGLNINSGVAYTVNGAIYSPTVAINMNSATWNQAACTYLVAASITFNSGSNFTLPQSNCASWGYPVPTLSGAVKLALVQ
jgi:hypothetical protein